MDWFQIARSEAATFFDLEERITVEEKQQRGTAAIDAFHHLFMVLAAELRIREEWPEAHCHIVPFSTGIIEHSAKMRVDFTLGISIHGWFIEAWIASPDQIRQMRDDYWEHIARLSTLGKAEFEDGGRPVGWSNSAKIRKLTQHKCSLVFSIVRDFVLLASTSEGCSSLGRIYITIPLESDEEAVRTFFKRSLESLYRSNHMLYRAEYLERRRYLKRFEAQMADEPEEV